MMKLSTIATTTTLLLLSGKAYASHEETSIHTRRMRSVKIYSSTPQRNDNDGESGKDVVDPYIGLPDEREQRGLAKHKKPSAVSAPNTIIPSLEMSMPAGTSVPSHSQSLSFPLLKGSTSTGENDALPYQRVMKHSKTSAEKMPVPTLEMSMPTGSSMSMPVQSFSYSLQDTISIGENDILIRRRAAEEETVNSAMTANHSSAIVAAAIVSAIVGAVALL